MDENKNNVVDIKDVVNEAEKPVENQNADSAEGKQEAEVKHTVFGKLDQKILARRAARAKKKAEKKPMDKGTKAAIIGGSVALGVGILGAVGKAALNAAARYADEPETDDDSFAGYPTEDDSEEPTEVEVEVQKETTETDEET